MGGLSSETAAEGARIEQGLGDSLDGVVRRLLKQEARSYD